MPLSPSQPIHPANTGRVYILYGTLRKLLMHFVVLFLTTPIIAYNIAPLKMEVGAQLKAIEQISLSFVQMQRFLIVQSKIVNMTEFILRDSIRVGLTTVLFVMGEYTTVS